MKAVFLGVFSIISAFGLLTLAVTYLEKAGAALTPATRFLLQGAFFALIINVLLWGLFRIEQREDEYLLEQGVPRCVVFEYECALDQGGTSK